MKYIHTQTQEVWTGAKSTAQTSNFYLLSHEEKVALGWQLVADDVPSLEGVKESTMQLMKSKATQYIADTYPQYKQVNASLGIYGEQFKTDMVAFIQTVRAKVHTYETQITQAQSISELEALNFTFEE